MNTTIRNERAFSVMECLVVLVIIGVFMTIAMPGFKKTVMELQGKQFIGQLSADLYWAANVSRSRGLGVDIVIDVNNQCYKVRTVWDGIQKTVQVPKGFTVWSNFSSLLISFNKFGHVAQAGTLSVIYPDGTKRKITVYMASGRFMVSSQP
jgi:prepilin-type N-terminal cleavage/methylation domain-containing protein